MSPERVDDEVEDLLAAFVLGATDPEEDALVRAHLEGCAACTSTVQRLRRVLGAIPEGADTVSPPPRLRQQILEAAAAARHSELATSRKARVFRLRPPRPRIWPVGAGWRSAAAAAAIVAFALGAGLGLGVGRSIAPQPAPASSVTQYSLSGSGAMSGAQGKVYELKQQGLTLVEFSNLPELEAGKVYELWLIPSQGQPAPAGVFKPDPGGSHVVVLARNLQGLTALAVTAEAGPNGTSAPSQQPQLAGKVG
jgi:anti-sigma-K factor RskA